MLIVCRFFRLLASGSIKSSRGNLKENADNQQVKTQRLKGNVRME
jgi:hypothetical protein